MEQGDQGKENKQAMVFNLEKIIDRKITDITGLSKDMDKTNIDRVYRELKQNILETLHKNGYREHIGNAEQILERNKYEIQKSFQISRETKAKALLSNRENTINTSEIKEVSKDETEEQVNNRKFINNSMENVTGFTKEIDKDITVKVNYKIDDVIQTVLPAELRRIIDSNRDKRLAEHVYGEVSRHLSRNTLERLKEGYKNTTKEQNEMLFNEVDKVLQEYENQSLNEYRKTVNNKDNMKEKSDDSFEGKLKGGVLPLEEQFENYLPGEKGLDQVAEKNTRTELEDMFK